MHDILRFPFGEVEVQCGLIFRTPGLILEGHFMEADPIDRGKIIQHIILRIFHHLKPVVLQQQERFGGMIRNIIR